MRATPTRLAHLIFHLRLKKSLELEANDVVQEHGIIQHLLRCFALRHCPLKLKAGEGEDTQKETGSMRVIKGFVAAQKHGGPENDFGLPSFLHSVAMATPCVSQQRSASKSVRRATRCREEGGGHSTILHQSTHITSSSSIRARLQQHHSARTAQSRHPPSLHNLGGARSPYCSEPSSWYLGHHGPPPPGPFCVDRLTQHRRTGA